MGNTPTLEILLNSPQAIGIAFDRIEILFGSLAWRYSQIGLAKQRKAYKFLKDSFKAHRGIDLTRAIECYCEDSGKDAPIEGPEWLAWATLLATNDISTTKSYHSMAGFHDGFMTALKALDQVTLGVSNDPAADYWDEIDAYNAEEDRRRDAESPFDNEWEALEALKDDPRGIDW